ncbi:MAG: hypothetical protein J5824_06215 [Lachnospiraceae bacterium]|nr:hypothetical protein [Lachnospiraceae bacterium]
MKKLFKVLAIALAMILSVSIAQPVGTKAASKPKLNAKKKTVYVGGSSVYSKYKNGYTTIKVYKRPKQYTVDWTSSDPNVIKIEPQGKYKCTVTALVPGTATVTAEVIDKTKTPNTKYTLTCKITVKANCAAVDITPSTVDELEIGETISLTGTMYNKAGKALVKGVSVTDTIKWASSDENIVTVSDNGVVKAIGEGTATITCYTVQATSGTYAKMTKATAKDTVTIKVKHVETAIESVDQKSLKTVNVFFGKDYSAVLKPENIKIFRGSGEVDIAKVEFAKNGLSALVTTKNELSASTEYTVQVTGTTAVDGLTATFKTSAGIPSAMNLYTDIPGNLIVAGQISEIYFQLYDSNGIDITPTDRSSSAYTTYASYITCKAADFSGVISYVNGRHVMIYEEGKSIKINGSFNNYKGTSFATTITVTAVNEASTMQLVGTTITKSSKAAADLDWNNTVHKISSSDFSAGYKLVAKVQKADGTYIYSDASDTKITFAVPDNYNPSAVFCDQSGVLRPFQTGSDSLVVKYNGVVIGSVFVEVGVARVPSVIKVLVDGQEASVVSMSDSTASNPALSVAVYDNYGELWSEANASELTLTCTLTGAPAVYPSSVKSDGVIDLNLLTYGSGSLSGSAYNYLVTYEHAGVKTATSFTMMVFKPDERLETTYKAVVSGDTDMVVNSNFDTANGKKVVITFVSYKGTVRYQDLHLTTKNLAAVGGFYAVVKNSNGDEVSLTQDTNSLVLPIAKVEGNTITKALPGNYTYVIYQKTSGTTDTPKAGGSFMISDSQEGAKYEQISTTTAFALTKTSSQTTADSILAQNFRLSYNGTAASGVVTDYIAEQGYIFIRTIAVTGTVKVGNVSYSIQVPLTINRLVNSISR